MSQQSSALSAIRSVNGRPKSLVHQLALAAVWLTLASSSIVFMEPAPVDALMIGLFVLLPVIGLIDAKPELAGGMALWMIVSAGMAVSAVLARDQPLATSHSLVSFYLAVSCFVVAAFVAKNPEAHTRLLLSGYLFAAIVAAALGIAGYLDLFPGAEDALTRYGRATGLFKDPNVYGPFLICGFITCFHYFLNKPLARGFWYAIGGVFIAVGILFSFSRGAWAATGIAVVLYSYLFMITTSRNWERLKLAGIVLGGVAILGLILLFALQNDAIGELLKQRATLTQSYDSGVDGRFGGQAKAVGLLLENPLGIGSQAFTRFYHHEEVHNVYLSMFLNGGWLGGLFFFLISAGTLALGFRHGLQKTPTQPLFLIVYAALAGNIIEGVLIDTDHWRHFYILMGIVWGLMASDVRVPRPARIRSDLPHRAPIFEKMPEPVRALTLPGAAHMGEAPRRAQRIGEPATESGVVINFGRRRAALLRNRQRSVDGDLLA